MLSSALNSSLSGMSAASAAISITANNLANSLTDGFKSSRAVLADQTPQTFDDSSNPTQIGRGVQVVAIEGDFSQGPIVPSSDPMDLALEGAGFFVLEGSGGEQQYTRAGRFHFNGNGELVNSSGLNVLGFNVDGNFHLDTNNLEAIKLPRRHAPPSGASLAGFDVGDDGTLRGRFTDGVVRDLGQVQLAQFANPGGLVARGHNTFSTSSSASLPNFSNPGSTRVISGAREYSNTNMAGELINLSLYSTMFRANLQVSQTANEMFEELLNLRRY